MNRDTSKDKAGPNKHTGAVPGHKHHVMLDS